MRVSQTASSTADSALVDEGTPSTAAGLPVLPTGEIRARLALLRNPSATKVRSELNTPLLRGVIQGHEAMQKGGQGDDMRASYADPLIILQRAGLEDLKGLSILDFGSGTGAWLVNAAAMGAQCVGIEGPTPGATEPAYFACYYVGETPPRPEGTSVPVTVCGQFPLWPSMRKTIGGGYDVLISKNVLKRGHVRGDPAPIDLGVSDQELLRAFFNTLTPGGLFLVYHVGAVPPPGQKAVLSMDIAVPYSPEQFEEAGFEVLVHEADATALNQHALTAVGYPEAEARRALYTLVRRPLAASTGLPEASPEDQDVFEAAVE